MSEVQLQIRQRLHRCIGIDFRKTFRKSRHLRVDREGHRRQGVEGSNRSNCKIERGSGPSSFTYEKSVNGWITCISPSKPNELLCTFSHVREILNEASAPVSKTLRNVSPSNLMGFAVVGGGRIKSGTSGFVGGTNTVDPRSQVLP